MKKNRIKNIVFLLLFMSAIVIPLTQNNKDMAKRADMQTPQSDNSSAKVPIIMYHKVSKNTAALGKFTISPQEFENDLKFLEKNGYTTVLIADLIDYVNGQRELPEKPVVLTFDDGNFSDFLYVYPLLKEYNMKAVFSIIGKPTDDYSEEGRTDITYPHLIWPQITLMIESGLIEIQNHSYDLHGANGSYKLSKESAQQYKTRFRNDIYKMQVRTNQITGLSPTTFTYPLGKISKESYEVLSDLGFLSSLTCYEGNNVIIKEQPQCLFLLNRCIRPHGKPVARVLGAI